MKLVKRLLVIVIFSIFVFSPQVYAGTAYVDSINIDAIVEARGSMTVTETIKWEIEEDLNGVYRDILIESANTLNGASNIDIIEVWVNGELFSYSALALQNGDSGKYNVNEIDGGKQVRIYTPSEDETKTTVIKYKLYDVAVRYNDVAEVYWNFIGSGWDYGINDVKINITVPENTSMLKIFGHGPLYGYSEIVDNNKVTLTVNNLRSNEQVDARVIFDADVVTPIKVVDNDMLENILAQEGRLAVEANERREKAKVAFVGTIVVTVVALIIPIIVYWISKKKSLKSTFDGKYYRELVEDYGPAVMSKIMNPVLNTGSYDMLATMLDLVRRKYIEIEPIQKENKKKPEDYMLKLTNTNLENLNEQEQHFVRKLIFVDTNEIALKELSKKNSKTIFDQNKAVKAHEKWYKLITKVAKEKGLIAKKKVSVIKDVLKLIISPLMLIAVIVYGITNGFDDIMGIGMCGVFVCIFEFVFVIGGLYTLKLRTQKGVDHNEMWEAFRRYLLDFSKLDEHDYKSLVIWEHYLVYAAGLGVAKKVIKQLKIVFPKEFKEDSFNTYMPIVLLSDDGAFSSFQNSFNTASATAFSQASTNGSGGGFSGGAGFGGGGGGGGGF